VAFKNGSGRGLPAGPGHRALPPVFRGYPALEPGNPYRIADIRYSLPPNEIGGLWGIEPSRRAGGDDHVSHEVSRQVNPGALARFRAMPFD